MINRRSLVQTALLAGAFVLAGAVGAQAKTAHEFTLETIDGKPLPMSQFKGKTVLVVNTASKCGFTPQYEGLQALWTAKKGAGLVVLGIPSDDFNQELDTAAEVKDFCEGKYKVDFPLSSITVVKGDAAHPFYKWVAEQKGAPQWNFHKYLVNSRGELVGAYNSRTRPDAPELLTAIDASLAAK